LQLVHRLRLPALCCAFSVLLCELISRPYVNIGISDDWPYILMAQKLAATGHVLYNGWGAPMLTWQLYLAAAFIKLFGFSFTTVRMSSVLVAMILAFVLQRALVLADITERNATFGTLAFVLSPLYLVLSVTFMTDIHGLFAIVLCLYGCLAALRAPTARAAIAWLSFAVAGNVVCGTSRQIAWLGTLVMVPCTLWLLRARDRTQRRVWIGGFAIACAGFVAIFACMQWLKRQPYVVPEHLLPKSVRVGLVAKSLSFLFLDATFLLLPLFAIFLKCLWNRNRSSIAVVILGCVAYTLLSIHRGYPFLMQPLWADWVDYHGLYFGIHFWGIQPVFLPHGVRLLFTIASLGGLLGLAISLCRGDPATPTEKASHAPSSNTLLVLLGPFSLAYIFLLLPRIADNTVFDRYLLPLLAFATLCLARYYQKRIHLRLGFECAVFILLMAAYGITTTSNMFAFYRARIALAAELRAHGVPDAAVDYGWEYNLGTELQFSDHINFPTIAVPAHAYASVPPPTGSCPMWWYDYTPHVHPLYGISFDPNACDGPAPFAPVHYSRWPYQTPGTLYIVRYSPTPRP
jgi:hypothetical protein